MLRRWLGWSVGKFSGGTNWFVANGLGWRWVAEKHGQGRSETEPCAVKRRCCACCGGASAAWAARLGEQRTGLRNWLRQRLRAKRLEVSVCHTAVLGGKQVPFGNDTLRGEGSRETGCLHSFLAHAACRISSAISTSLASVLSRKLAAFSAALAAVIKSRASPCRAFIQLCR